MKRCVAVLLVLLALGCATARADDASRRAKAEELFATLHMDQTMAQLMKLVMAQVQQSVNSVPGAENMTADQKAKVADFQKRVAALVSEKVGWKALEPDFVDLYATTYTEEELDGILAFYKSPVGQKMLEKTPELMARGVQISQRRMAELQPQLNQMLEDFMKQIAADASKPPAATSAPARKQPQL